MTTHNSRSMNHCLNESLLKTQSKAFNHSIKSRNHETTHMTTTKTSIRPMSLHKIGIGKRIKSKDFPQGNGNRSISMKQRDKSAKFINHSYLDNKSKSTLKIVRRSIQKDTFGKKASVKIIKRKNSFNTCVKQKSKKPNFCKMKNIIPVITLLKTIKNDSIKLKNRTKIKAKKTANFKNKENVNLISNNQILKIVKIKSNKKNVPNPEDRLTVIEHDCENNYDLICKSLNNQYS